LQVTIALIRLQVSAIATPLIIADRKCQWVFHEAKNLREQVALRLTAKWEQPYFVVLGFASNVPEFQHPKWANESNGSMAQA
jgi:hypothetical protein